MKYTQRNYAKDSTVPCREYQQMTSDWQRAAQNPIEKGVTSAL
jgi:hypothetical protein